MDFIHSFLRHLAIPGGVFILQKELSFLIIPLPEKIGKPVPDKLRKEFSIYVSIIRNKFNHKIGHMSYSPNFLSLVLHSWCNLSPFFLHMQVLGVLACWHGSVLWTQLANQEKKDILSVQKFIINALHFWASFNLFQVVLHGTICMIRFVWLLFGFSMIRLIWTCRFENRNNFLY